MPHGAQPRVLVAAKAPRGVGNQHLALVLIPYSWAPRVTFRQSGLPKEAGSGTRATTGAFETAQVCTLGTAHAAATDGCATAHRRNVPRSALRTERSLQSNDFFAGMGGMGGCLGPAIGGLWSPAPRRRRWRFFRLPPLTLFCKGQYIRLSHTMTGTPMTRLH